MSTLYLVRHGQACFGSDNYDQLSATGREQVQELGRYFSGLGQRIDRIHTGSLRRQTQTAQIIAAALGSPTPPLSHASALDEYDSDVILHRLPD